MRKNLVTCQILARQKIFIDVAGSVIIALNKKFHVNKFNDVGHVNKFLTWQYCHVNKYLSCQ
jgi:hypothetical protein